jgi:hypothetical protein
MMRLSPFGFVLALFGAAGCSASDALDDSEAAVSGPPGLATERAQAEAAAKAAETAAKRELAFVEATRPAILLERYRRVPDKDVLSHLVPRPDSAGCLSEPSYVELFEWFPYRGALLEGQATTAAAYAYMRAVSDNGFEPNLQIIQRKTGPTYEVSFVAVKGPSLCGAEGRLSEGARVVLRCTNVDANGPDPAYCAVPAKDSPEAIPR